MKKKFVLISLLLSFGLIFAQSQKKYFEGDGGEGITIEIDKVSAKNISNDTAWLPDCIQNSVSDYITKYSAIKIIDKKNQNKIGDSIRQDELNATDISKLSDADFTIAKNILFVEIIEKSFPNYSVSFKITDKETSSVKAAFNEPNCNYQDLDNGFIPKKATLDLLNQMNIKLTEEAKKELLDITSAESVNQLQAQKYFAQGEVLQNKRNGSEIEALTYYMKAKTSDRNLQRAQNALLSTSMIITSKDFGERARNLEKNRNDFKNLLESIQEDYKKNPPYTFIYEMPFRQGKIDYENHTYPCEFTGAVVRNPDDIEFVNRLKEFYENAEDHENWGLKSTLNNLFPHSFIFTEFQILDGNNKVLGTSIERFSASFDIDSRTCRVSISTQEDTNKLKLKIGSIRLQYDSLIGTRNVQALPKIDISIMPSKEFFKNHFSLIKLTADSGFSFVTYPQILNKYFDAFYKNPTSRETLRYTVSDTTKYAEYNKVCPEILSLIAEKYPKAYMITFTEAPDPASAYKVYEKILSVDKNVLPYYTLTEKQLAKQQKEHKANVAKSKFINFLSGLLIVVGIIGGILVALGIITI